MPKITLLGRVFPPCYQVLFPQQMLDWKWQEENLLLHFALQIEKSEVTVECMLDTYQPSYLPEIHRRSLDIVRSAVNLAAFSTGIGFAVILERIRDDNGRETILTLKDDRLSTLCRSFSLTGAAGETPFGRIWALVVTEPSLFQALDDLIVSITWPHQATVNCARAIEGLRHLIADPGLSEPQAWEKMRSALQLDRSFLQLITDTSRAPRHGDRQRITGVVASEIVRRSWLVMDRFLEYRRRGNLPLPSVEFPLFTDTTLDSPKA